MRIIILCITLVFICLAFVINTAGQPLSNPLLAYLSHSSNVIVHHLVSFCIGFLLIIAVFFHFHFDKKNGIKKTAMNAAVQATVVTGLSIMIAYLILFFIAWVHLTIVGVLLEKNPLMLGILTSREAIATRLKVQNHPPVIIAIDANESQKIVQAVASATSGPETFYAKAILANVPALFILSVENTAADLFIIDNTLIVRKINPKDMQEISAAVGYLLVKNYFKSRQIRFYPRITIMDQKEYQAYRIEDNKKKLVKIDQQIEKLDTYISSLSASIKTDKRRDKQKEQLLAEYQYYTNFFKAQRIAFRSLRQSAPHELGVFEKRDSIKIVFDTNNSHAIGNYFETLTHEYLHYASFVNEDVRFDNSFFEEGLTEYFARAALKDAFQVDTNLGYPVQAKIISEMTKIIPESELAEIYFSKDEIALEKALDRVYGDGFYADNQVIFETLQYTSSPKQMLKLANEIMKKIGAEPLTEKDLKSSYSSL